MGSQGAMIYQINQSVGSARANVTSAVRGFGTKYSTRMLGGEIANQDARKADAILAVSCAITSDSPPHHSAANEERDKMVKIPLIETVPFLLLLCKACSADDPYFSFRDGH